MPAMHSVPALGTRRLALDPYLPTDEDDFVALFQDERVSRWMGEVRRKRPRTGLCSDGSSPRVYAQDLFPVWAVRRDGRLVGHAEIKPTEAVGGHEIVYALSPDTWGLGLGTELAEALVDYGFDALGLAAVHATVASQN